VITPDEPRGGRARYVVVTGAIAAGASTLSQVLAERLGWQTHLEGHVEVDDDFFSRAASDLNRWGLASQAHFLLASVDRHAALKARLKAAAPGHVIVEDRTPFEHTAVYVAAHELTGALPVKQISSRTSCCVAGRVARSVGGSPSMYRTAFATAVAADSRTSTRSPAAPSRL